MHTIRRVWRSKHAFARAIDFRNGCAGIAIVIQSGDDIVAANARGRVLGIARAGNGRDGSIGAVLAAIALFVMPNSPALWFAAMMLWILDASLNISMEPFRAFVGDMLGKHQHVAGYAVQTAFIGAGAVVGSLFPYALDHLGVSNVAAAGAVCDEELRRV